MLLTLGLACLPPASVGVGPATPDIVQTDAQYAGLWLLHGTVVDPLTHEVVVVVRTPTPVTLDRQLVITGEVEGVVFHGVPAAEDSQLAVRVHRPVAIFGPESPQSRAEGILGAAYPGATLDLVGQLSRPDPDAMFDDEVDLVHGFQVRIAPGVTGFVRSLDLGGSWKEPNLAMFGTPRRASGSFVVAETKEVVPLRCAVVLRRPTWSYGDWEADPEVAPDSWVLADAVVFGTLMNEQACETDPMPPPQSRQASLASPQARQDAVEHFFSVGATLVMDDGSGCQSYHVEQGEREGVRLLTREWVEERPDATVTHKSWQPVGIQDSLLFFGHRDGKAEYAWRASPTSYIQEGYPIFACLPRPLDAIAWTQDELVTVSTQAGAFPNQRGPMLALPEFYPPGPRFFTSMEACEGARLASLPTGGLHCG